MPVRRVTPELQCRNCGDWLILIFKNHRITRDGLRLLIRNGPMLQCPSCQYRKALAKQVGRRPPRQTRLTRITRAGFAVVTLRHDSSSENYFPVFAPKRLDQLKRKKKFRVELRPKVPEQRFNFGKVPFTYDARDYYYLPGLYRSSGDGYLTPVFFNVEVLLKYVHHPDCALDFASDTYGTLHTKDGQTTAFGINRSGHVIMWLGDIDRLSESEQHYLASENRASDHDVGSQFYAGQIEVAFTPASKEKLLLAARHKVMNSFFEKLGIKLVHFDLEVIDVLRKIRRPIVWDDNSVGQTIENLNKALVETINAEAIKKDLHQIDSSLDLSKINTLKLFRKWLEMKCTFSDPATLLSPLFVLYDLRVLSAHLLSNRKRKKLLVSVRKRLRLPVESTTVKEIYVALIKALKEMYDDVHSRIPSLP